MANPKGMVLEMGAQFSETILVPPFVDHQPTFEATLGLNGDKQQVKGRGSTKLEAEENAAREFLQTYAQHSPKSPTDSINTYTNESFADADGETFSSFGRSDDDSSSPPRKHNDKPTLPPISEEWTLFTLDSDSYRSSEGESLQDWWKRGAQREKSAFVRAFRSQRVFPDHIAATRSWSCMWQGHKMVVFALQMTDGAQHSFIECSPQS